MSVSGIASGTVPSIEVQRPDENSRSMASMVKDVRKARMQRELYAKPELAGKLVALQASPVYNSKAEIIQSTGLDL